MNMIIRLKYAYTTDNEGDTALNTIILVFGSKAQMRIEVNDTFYYIDWQLFNELKQKFEGLNLDAEKKIGVWKNEL